MKKERTQQELLRAARERLKIDNRELAARLGKSLPTLYAWLARDTAPMHRNMPAGSRMLLARILKEQRAKK